jgi:hypothetical protein
MSLTESIRTVLKTAGANLVIANAALHRAHIESLGATAGQ